MAYLQQDKIVLVFPFFPLFFSVKVTLGFSITAAPSHFLPWLRLAPRNLSDHVLMVLSLWKLAGIWRVFSGKLLS